MVLTSTQTNADTEIDIKNSVSIDENKSVTLPDVSKLKPLHEKIFKHADSYMTKLLKDEHIQTIYHIFVVALFFLITYSICHDYFTCGRIYLGWLTIEPGFKGLPYAIGCWFIIHLIAIINYFGVSLWQKIHALSKTADYKFCINAVFLTCYITVIGASFSLCALCCLRYDLRFGSALFILMETTRLIMKMHAFVRSTIGQTADPMPTADAVKRLSGLRHYIYFLFAPVLIYRSSYPRTTTPIRWTFVMTRLMEILFAIFYFTYFYERFIGPHYRQFGVTAPQWAGVIESFYAMLLPSTLCLLLFIYMLLYSVQNLFAELLHFGDRRFFTNWWSVTNYRDYFIKWNCLVQDWLYEYIYKDCYNYVCANRFVCSFSVVTISAIVHEILIGLALQLFLPINYLCFGVLSYIIMYLPLRGRFGNVIVWSCIVFGMALQLSLYSMEAFAKLNCPKALNDSSVDRLLPYIWTCIQIHRKLDE
ncbi:sterol O-acyltransferase 1-like [Zeugodacus cucurbitae]|uniref:sterol O-acyltransferase 1-like n=1 Tax=Zeugodacus cucurbitae TaxID=28588 RepID=UPI0023D8F3F4|nr:sterol O-acyltransferase 1-like [Zeugodacus cucurbitae]